MTIQAQSTELSLADNPKVRSAFSQLPTWPPLKLTGPKQSEAADAESGYGTDTDRSDVLSSYPGSPMSNGWNPINTPKVVNFDSFRFPPPSHKITSTPWVEPSPPGSPGPVTSKRLGSDDGAPDERTPLNPSFQQSPVSPKRRKVSRTPTSNMTPEIEAACTLMKLNVADARLCDEKKGLRPRRASA